MKTSFLRSSLLGAALFVVTGTVAPVVHAKDRNQAVRLEIWPGQRALVILPLTVSETFLSGSEGTNATSGSNALGRALVPVLSPLLSTALQNTGKFSISRPYKFDPLIRRALAEQRVNDDDVNAFVETPSLTTTQGVLSQLGLEQPGMVAQLVLQQLTVGGTPELPTVQLTMRGDLYETGSAQPFRSITVTSKPFGGKTPEERLRAAAGEAFTDIANAFVEPPAEFELPAPVAPPPTAGTTETGTGTMTTMPPLTGTPTPAAPTPGMPMAPNPSNTGNAPVAPQLPSSPPPLGVPVPDDN